MEEGDKLFSTRGINQPSGASIGARGAVPGAEKKKEGVEAGDATSFSVIRSHTAGRKGRSSVTRQRILCIPTSLICFKGTAYRQFTHMCNTHPLYPHQFTYVCL